MNKLQTLFPQKTPYAAADTTNHAGAPAFTRSLEEQTVQVLMTGNLEDTFYCSADQLAKSAIDVLTKSATKDPEFLAKALVYARNEGYLRLAPIVGLLVLSKERPDLFKQVFRSVILQPGDLQDFVTLVRSKTVRSTGKSIRTAVGDWMNTISDYHVVKYGAPQKKPGAGSPVNLRDILRLTHPVPANDTQAALFTYIVKRIKGDKVEDSLLERLPAKVQAYEKFKDLSETPEKAKKNEKKLLELIAENDLPYEVVTARLSTPAAWEAMASKAPFMNMLRNLNNYEKNGVFKNKDLKKKVIGRLRDKEQISKSKQFPFRFLAAYNAFQGDADVRDAIVGAVDLSVLNIPDLGRTLVATDESGSMDTKLSDRSEITMREVGNLFAAALWKKSDGGYLVPFTDSVFPVGMTKADYNSALEKYRTRHGDRYDYLVDAATRTMGSVNKRDSLVTIAQQLAQVSGGTDLAAPLDWALNTGAEFDTGIFISDNESWADHLRRGHGVLESIRKFRSRNPRAQFFFVQLALNMALQAPQSEPGVHFIYGWSDNVLKYIASTVAGGNGQVAEINGMELPAMAIRPGGWVGKKKVKVSKKVKAPKAKARKKLK